MAPSSIHENGNRYEWEQAPDEFVIEKADDLVYRFIDFVRSEKKGKSTFSVPEEYRKAAGITLFSVWPAVYRRKGYQMRPFWLQQ